MARTKMTPKEISQAGQRAASFQTSRFRLRRAKGSFASRKAAWEEANPGKRYPHNEPKGPSAVPRPGRAGSKFKTHMRDCST
jgi:hypothetical protein